MQQFSNIGYAPFRQSPIMPKWVSNSAIGVYVLALLVVSIIYINRLLPWYFMLSGVVAVLVFFLCSSQLSRKWSTQQVHSEKRFERRLFLVSLLIRLAYTLLIYFIFTEHWGHPYGFEDGDATAYDQLASGFANALRGGYFNDAWESTGKQMELSDLGYALYLMVIYLLTDNSVLFARIIKCIWSALTVLIIYRLAKRNFGDEVGRTAAILCMLWPNFWYYCGCHLKEVEMVFLAALFVNQADDMFKSRKFTAWKIVPVLLLAGALFTIRTPLALVAVLSLLFTIFMSSSRVVSWRKRITVGSLVLLLVGVTMGNRIQEEAQGLYDKVASGGQQANMEWRSKRGTGAKQSFAKYAGAAVFAPMIFTIPFPTMTTIQDDYQQLQRMVHGANFDKNIISFFVILSMFFLLFSGKWRDHMLPLSFMLGYLVVLAFSYFAQSERFHQPAMPFEMMFAAYGISIVVQGKPFRPGLGNKATYRRWFTYWCVFMFIAAIAWNWFKLAGRGLV